MLSFLQIRDFAIVESIDLELGDGFTCITGETGAGKSILVGALGLLTGQRADTSAVREGCSKAELTAGFEIEADSAAARWLENADLADGTSCLLRRMISDKGRSRAWINGTAVTLQQLAELGAHLVEIHGQNEHLRLLQPRDQFRLLDTAKESRGLQRDLAETFAAWQDRMKEKESLLAMTPLDAGDTELLEFHLAELEPILDDSRDYSALDAEHRKLARAGEIQQALLAALAAFDPDTGLASMLSRSLHELEAYSGLDEEIDTAIKLMEEASINCEEARASIDRATSRLAQDPQRLVELERSLSSLHDLARKHRAEPDALSEVAEQLRDRLERSAERDQRLAQLEPEIEEALRAYRTAALDVHESRARAAAELSEAVSGLMQELGMEGGVFRIDVEHRPESPPAISGTDRLEFMVSANPGAVPGPLRKVASGGELSRISLAIKVASRTSAGETVQIFDEVDAGIGGETARSVGALIRSLSVEGQALCVTHLAQVAVFADHQLQVSKSSKQMETRVDTRLLAEDQRVDEIARMLGGQLSDQSRAHASELLAAASTRH